VETIEADIAASKAKKRRNVKTTVRPSELTLDQQVEIGAAEAEASKKDTQQMMQDAQRTFDMLRALLEQADLRATELKKEAHEFRRDVVLAGENGRNGTVLSEKVVSFYEDGLRKKDNTIDKLKLKVAALKQQEVKLSAGLSAQEEVGDVLHYIDFHQLQIENTQAQATLEERNTELMRLKLTTGATVGSLNSLKSRLSGFMKESSRLKSDIVTRRAMCGKLREENAGLTAMVARARVRHNTLVVQAKEARDMPQVLDYVELTRTQAALTKERTDWGRKVEIASMAEAAATAKLRSAVTSGTLGAELSSSLTSTVRALGLTGRAVSRGTASRGTAVLGGSARAASASRTSATIASTLAGIPGAGGPVSFGSTTAKAGVTGTRGAGQGGRPVGKLALGRPVTLEETERRRAQALSAAILDGSTAHLRR
jgi:hypothetical protein